MSSRYDYTNIYNTAVNLIFRFGSSEVHKYADPSFSRVYSPANGGYVYSDGTTTYDEPPMLSENVEGVVTDYTEDERRDTSIKVGDKKLLTVEITAPQASDIFVIGTTEYSYINHETIQPASTSDPLLYKIQLRV